MQVFQKIKQEASFWLGRRLPTCKELCRWMSESLERKLSLRERIILKLHFLICVWCERYLEQIQLLRDAARHHASKIEDGPPPTASLSPEARERIKRALAGRKD